MTQQEFVSFNGVKFIFRQPHTLKITKVMAVPLTQNYIHKDWSRARNKLGPACRGSKISGLPESDSSTTNIS